MVSQSILFGAAYYDEYMPYDRLEKDMEMMKAASMNVIRIGESTWSTLEPTDGVFDFTYLDRMLKASKKYNINVIIGTPTYAIPPWLCKKCPDILAITKDGPGIYGHRQNMDITHSDYLFHAKRLIKRLMEHIMSYDHIIGFQLDNETKSYGTAGPRVQAMFVQYLKDKYKTIEALNQAFGLAYWSNSMSSFDDFPNVLGTINGSLLGEFNKFQRLLVEQFLSWQSEIIREYTNDSQFITQNFDFDWRGYSFGIQPETDQFACAKAMSIAGVDIYHPSQDDLTGAEIAFGGAVGRAISKKCGLAKTPVSNYLVLETQAQGNPAWLPYSGQLRMQAFSHLASGANSVMYWHWHSIHNACETYWKGVLSHDLSENATYQEAVQTGLEIKKIGNRLFHLQKKCPVAIMVNNESITGLSIFQMQENFGFNDVVRWLYDEFYKLNIECDIIHSNEENLEQYQLIVLPALYSVSDEVLLRLRSYTENGGNLLATFKTAFTNSELTVHSDHQPHLLTDCFGMTYDQFTIPKNVGLVSNLTGNGPAPMVTNWMELLIPSTASVWANYRHQHFCKHAAITHNQFGQGTATYLGCYFSSSFLNTILRNLCNTIGIALTDYRFPIIKKSGVNEFGEEIHYFFNYSNQHSEFHYDRKDGTLLLKGSPIHQGDLITLEPWNFVIVETKNNFS